MLCATRGDATAGRDADASPAEAITRSMLHLAIGAGYQSNLAAMSRGLARRSGYRCRWWLIRHGGFARLGRLGGYARLLWITRNAGGAPAIVVGVRGIAVRLSVHIVLHCIRPRLRASAVEARAGYFYPTFRRPKHLPRCLTTSGRQEPGTRRTDRRHPALRCEC